MATAEVVRCSLNGEHPSLLRNCYLMGREAAAYDILRDAFLCPNLSWSEKEEMLFVVLYHEASMKRMENLYQLIAFWKPEIFKHHVQSALPFDLFYYELIWIGSTSCPISMLLDWIRLTDALIATPYQAQWNLLCAQAISRRGEILQAIPFFRKSFHLYPPHQKWKTLLVHARQWHICRDFSKENFLGLIELGCRYCPRSKLHLFHAVCVDYLLAMGHIIEAERYAWARLWTSERSLFQHFQILMAVLTRKRDFHTAFWIMQSPAPELTLMNEKVAIWQVRRLIFWASKSEWQQLHFLQELHPKWKTNLTVLCGQMNFVLNPTNRSFSLSHAEGLFNQIVQKTARRTGDVVVFGVRLFCIKSLLSQQIWPSELKVPRVIPFPPHWIHTWIQQAKLSEPFTGHYFTLFQQSYEDLPCDVIDTLVYEMEKDVLKFQALFIAAYLHSWHPSEYSYRNLMSNPMTHTYRKSSWFGDFFPRVACSSRMFPIREQLFG